MVSMNFLLECRWLSSISNGITHQRAAARIHERGSELIMLILEKVKLDTIKEIYSVSINMFGDGFVVVIIFVLSDRKMVDQRGCYLTRIQ